MLRNFGVLRRCASLLTVISVHSALAGECWDPKGLCPEPCPAADSCRSHADCAEDMVCTLGCLPSECACEGQQGWTCTDDCAGECAPVPAIPYVDTAAPGPVHDGSSWCNAYRYVQDALAAAEKSGGAVTEIRVARGTHWPDRDMSNATGSRDREASFRLVNGVALRGGYAGCRGPDPDDRDFSLYETILSGDLRQNDDPTPDVIHWDDSSRQDNSYHVVTDISMDSPALLEGFTVTGGNANANGSSGGGILCGKAIIRDCAISGNTAGDSGGGISLGVGVEIPQIVNCLINRNSAVRGGGLVCHNGKATIAHCTISSNSATGYGGGIYLLGGTPRISGCLVENNVAPLGGGISVTDWGDALLVNSTMQNNTASASGGGVHTMLSDLRAINCVVLGNTAPETGGGAYSLQSHSRFINCSFSRNSASLGGGIYGGRSDTQLENCVLWGDIAPAGPEIAISGEGGGGTTVGVGHSDVQGGEPAIDVGGGADVYWFEGNINASPLFATPTDPHLDSGSPCIDAGRSDVIPPDVLDLDGDGDTSERTPVDRDWYARFVDDQASIDTGNGTPAFVDIGAYEYQTDCNANDVFDSIEIALGTSPDCNENTIPDECEDDCNNNNVEDECDIAHRTSLDCNRNAIPDECDIQSGVSDDANLDGIPDECQVRLFVDSRANGMNDGASWADAFVDLQHALDEAERLNLPVLEIWVATGVYKPDRGTGDRYATFLLPDHVGLYGGFLGTETAREQRNATTNHTILSGDIASNDRSGFANDGDNSLHVVTANGTDASSYLDGFTIQGGNASSSSWPHGYGGALLSDGRGLTVAGCLFLDNAAREDGGAVASNNSSLMLIDCMFRGNRAGASGGALTQFDSLLAAWNCRFIGNTARYGGGAVDMSQSTAEFLNCAYFGNSTTSVGGAIHSSNAELGLINCTLNGNVTGFEGGAIRAVQGTNAAVINSILWENVDASGFTQAAQLSFTNSSLTVSSSCVQGWTGSIGGVGNTHLDPLFVPGPGGCYYLSQTAAGQAVDSPCADAGNDTSANLGLDAMTTRSDEGVDVGVVDMGYHYPVTGQPLIFGDYDRNGKVDLADVAAFQNCFTGEGPAALPPCCRVFDSEPDGDVDLYDHRLLWVAVMLPVCGNGVVEFGEECDDGNLLPGDGCDDHCRAEGNNDNCSSPRLIGLGTTPFSNEGATTDGPEETDPACALAGDTQIGSDIWYCFTSPCTDDVIVSLCGTYFDSKMAVYEGCGCPAEPSVACSDDDCGPGQGSRFQFPAQTGQSYMLRVGGYDGAQGTGTITIFCEGDPNHGLDACGPGAGDCFSANGSPACEDVECCVRTCEVDPFCCDTEWDSLCADKADGICGDGFDTCGPGAGDCTEPIGNGSPGCEDVACCQAVCERDPFCCLTEWDDICAGDAWSICTPLEVCADATGDCHTANDTPGCVVQSCCDAVCVIDPPCCDDVWDATCADRAALFAECQ